MPEFFKIDEYKKIDEYQKIEAENYSKSKELFDSAEFKNDIEEFQTSDDKKINKNSKNKNVKQEKQDFDRKSNNEKINEINDEIKNIDKSINEISNTIGTNVASTVSTVAGTITAAVAGSVGAVVICTNLLVATPKMEIISIDTGANYINYDVDITDLTEDISYSIVIENAYGSYIFPVVEGKNKNFVSGLKPYCKYTMSLVSNNKELDGYRTYYQESFYTKKADNPEAVLFYDVVTDYDNHVVDLDYKIFISDFYKVGIDYYYTVSFQDEVVFTDNDLTDDYYFFGKLDNVSEGDYKFNYYCNFYDEDILVGTDTVTIGYPEDFIPSKVDFEIDNLNLSGDYKGGYDLNIDLTGYNELATYELAIESKSFRKTYKFTSNHIEINDLPIDYRSTKLYLRIKFLNDEYNYEYLLSDLVGIDILFSTPEYNKDINSSIFDYNIINNNEYDINNISFAGTNEFNENKQFIPKDNKLTVDLCGNISLETILELDNLSIRFIDEMNLKNIISLDGLQYIDDSNVLLLKSINYLPDDANVFVTVNDVKLNSINGYEYMDGYYAFECSSLEQGSVIKLCAEIDGNIIECECEEIIVNNEFTIPTYSYSKFSASDIMISYNNDSTFNAYIPINFKCSDEAVWYRIVINDEICIDSRDYILLLENLDPTKTY